MYSKTKIVAQLYYGNRVFDTINYKPVDVDDLDVHKHERFEFHDTWFVVNEINNVYETEKEVWHNACTKPMWLRLPAGDYAVAYCEPRTVAFKVDEDELLEEEPADLNDVVWSTEDILKREA